MSDSESVREDSLRPTGRDLLLWGLLILVVLGLLGATLWRSISGTSSPSGVVEAPLPILGSVPHFSLTNQDGQLFERSALDGRLWVADFIFTRCAAICPRMTEKMKQLRERLPAGEEVLSISFSVDPDHDTPEVLSVYAERYGASDGWHFLTGGRQEIHELCRDGFMLAVGEAEPDAVDPIFHSNRFVLVDQRGQIRGYYNVFEADEMERLLKEINQLL